MDTKDLTEFGRREAMSHKDVKDDKDNAHAKRYKYSSKKLDLVKQGLHGGGSISSACGAAGISVKTFYRWKDELIKDQAQTDWRAAAWILERRYPDEWAKRQEHEVIIEKKSSEDVVKSMLVNIIQKENLES